MAIANAAVERWLMPSVSAGALALAVLIGAQPDTLLGHWLQEAAAGRLFRAEPARTLPLVSFRRSAPSSLSFPDFPGNVRLGASGARDAALVNASIPISTAPLIPAAPLALPMTEAPGRAREAQCLAEAVAYEAPAGDAAGGAAVAQVILNRLRDPNYPKTICGVVYQGSERPTGCQFTFTCDGSRARPLSAMTWIRAREVAERALTGSVYAPVGLATHYHTQWVVPYWISGLVKVAQVGPHLFYRRPGAFAAGTVNLARMVSGAPAVAPAAPGVVGAVAALAPAAAPLAHNLQQPAPSVPIEGAQAAVKVAAGGIIEVVAPPRPIATVLDREEGIASRGGPDRRVTIPAALWSSGACADPASGRCG